MSAERPAPGADHPDNNPLPPEVSQTLNFFNAVNTSAQQAAIELRNAMVAVVTTVPNNISVVWGWTQ